MAEIIPVVKAAQNLASKGCNILVVYNSDSSRNLAANLCLELSGQYNVQVHAVKTNLIDPEKAAETVVEFAKQYFTKIISGTTKLTIDILVNNAGVGGSYPLEAVSAQEFHRIYTINVLAPIVHSRSLPSSIARREGPLFWSDTIIPSLGTTLSCDISGGSV